MKPHAHNFSTNGMTAGSTMLVQSTWAVIPSASSCYRGSHEEYGT